MTFASIFSPIQHAIAEFCKIAALKCSKLNEYDFARIVAWVRIAATDKTLLTGEARAQWVADNVAKLLAGKVPPAFTSGVVMFAYHYAQRKGLIA